MKLRNKEEVLSNSLLNNSQITEDETANKNDIIKSKIIIRATKTPQIFNQQEFLKNIAKETENVFTDNIMNSRKTKRKTINKLAKHSDDDSSNNSILDLVLPPKKLKDKNSMGGKRSTKSHESLNNSLSNSEKRVSFHASSNSTSSGASPFHPFKTPTLPNKIRRSFKSPICASSPKIGSDKAVNTFGGSDSNVDLFSSAIISSSEEVSNQRSSQSCEDALFSPIRDSQTVRSTLSNM